MKTLVLGATGATGRLLVKQLLDRGEQVKVIVRSADRLPGVAQNNPKVEVIIASIAEMTVEQLATILADCDGAASCLGHNITFKGVFGHPKKLVHDAVRLTCEAIKQNAPKLPVRFVLMNTVGNTNKDKDERKPLLDRLIISLLRTTVPPQSDNELAAEYLRTVIGQDNQLIEWAAVRPDTLKNASTSSPYSLHGSPLESVLFGGRETSRVNVAHFMAELLTDHELWNQWKGKMPVIYNER